MRLIIILISMVAFLLLNQFPAKADDISTLKQQILELKEQSQLQQKKIEELTEKLEAGLLTKEQSQLQQKKIEELTEKSRGGFAPKVHISGTLDAHFPTLLSGGKEGKIWKSGYVPSDTNKSFLGYHIFHPKFTIDVTEQIDGEVVVCFSDYHTPRVWVGSVDYTPFVPEDFGDTPIVIRAGIFYIPFGHHAYSYPSPVDMKTIVRPLMSPDHYKDGQMLNGGPEPILQSPTSDRGVMLYGSKWLREKDQLWYGAYVVDGISRTDGHPTSHEASDRNTAKHIGGKISYTWGELLTIGGSWLIGKWDPAEGKTDYATKGVHPQGGKLDYNLYGLDLHLALRKANLRFEYIENPVEWNLTTKGTKKGGYVQLDFPLDLIFKDSKVAKKFEFATMYSYLEGTKEKAAGQAYTFNSLSRTSVGLTFMPNPALKYKLEYSYMPLGTPSDRQYGDEFGDIQQLHLAVGLTF